MVKKNLSIVYLEILFSLTIVRYFWPWCTQLKILEGQGLKSDQRFALRIWQGFFSLNQQITAKKEVDILSLWFGNKNFKNLAVCTRRLFIHITNGKCILLFNLLRLTWQTEYFFLLIFWANNFLISTNLQIP